MAKILIYISYFFAFFGFLLGIIEIFELKTDQSVSFFYLILTPIAGSYFWWTFYWGQVWFWTSGKDWIIVTFSFFGWLPTIIFIFFSFLFIGTFYGILGGAIYQYIKYRMLIE